MLDVRLDGEVIATIEEQALAVRIQTSRGETSATGLGPDDGVIDIIIDRVAPGGPMRLDQAEAQVLQDLRDRTPEGSIVGFTRDFQVHPSGLSATQGTHNETLREGGVDRELTRRTRSNGSVPSIDLGHGLLPGDVEIRSARITAFGEHGDAQRAIDDNPADGGGNETGVARDSVTSADDPAYNPATPVGDDGSTGQESPTSGDDADQSGPGTGSSSEDDTPGDTTPKDTGQGSDGGIKLPGKSAKTS